jgi:hypothetical protein
MLNRYRALDFSWSMIPRLKPEGMLFGKSVPTRDQVRGRLFPDHALASEQDVAETAFDDPGGDASNLAGSTKRRFGRQALVLTQKEPVPQ